MPAPSPVLLLLTLLAPSSAVIDPLQNELVGTPEIACGAETIEMQFKTRQPFEGKVYVKGHYSRPECRVDYGAKTEDGQPTGGIRLNHGACDMDRQRMITPDGMMFSTVLVISFHPLFVTKVDRAFNIKCMYREATRVITQQLEVSALPTEALHFDIPLPKCSYTIRRDQLDGPILRFARVGDQVVHRWECESETYGVLVHSCYVEDGQGEKQLIVDERGCHTDHTLLGDPTYVEALNMAYRESYVFKFADRTAVRFQCEIRLCFKEDGGCDGITPPLCFDGEHNRINQVVTENRTRRAASREGASSFKPRDADLISQFVYVLDGEESNSLNRNESTTRGNDGSAFPVFTQPQSVLCMTRPQLIVFATCLTLSAILVLSLISYLLCLRLHRSATSYDTEGFIKY